MLHEWKAWSPEKQQHNSPKKNSPGSFPNLPASLPVNYTQKNRFRSHPPTIFFNSTPEGKEKGIPSPKVAGRSMEGGKKTLQNHGRLYPLGPGTLNLWGASPHVPFATWHNSVRICVLCDQREQAVGCRKGHCKEEEQRRNCWQRKLPPPPHELKRLLLNGSRRGTSDRKLPLFDNGVC